MRGLVVVLAVGVLLTGCTSATPTATTSATPSDTAAPVIRSWATRLAQIAAPYDEWSTLWKAHRCSASAFDNAPCTADLATGANAADQIELAIAGLDSPAGLGAPPAEIADLVSATVNAASEAKKNGDRYNSACPANPEPPKCPQFAAEFVRSLDQLGTQFAGWSQYR